MTYKTNHITNEIYDMVRSGTRVLSENKKALLLIEVDEFVMFSFKTGYHRLSVISTDVERLNSHWKGFIERQPI